MKQIISNQTNSTDNLPPVLENLRHEISGFKAPNGYFDSLSSRIVDRIQKQENKSFTEILLHYFRKPVIWVPSLAAMVVVLLLVFAIPANKTSIDHPTDEWTQINMAYDASYAEEAMLAESNNIDKAIEGRDINYSEPVSVTGQNEPTNEEIAKYIKEHQIDADILNEY